MPRKLHILKSLLILLCLLTSLPLTVLADVSISGLDDISINAWAGTTGNLQGSDDYCVTSFAQVCTGPPWNRTCTNTPRYYDVAAYTDGPAPSGNFVLTHTTNSSVTLPVTFEWSQPATGNSYEMSDYSTTGYTAPPGYPYAPGAVTCADSNALNTITITIDQGALASAIAGTYSETFYIDMCRRQGGFECVAAVSFNVNLPELIQITGLQNFTFGVWSGTGSVQDTKSFCVFRNGYGGFALTATGLNDSGSQFQLSSGTNNVPYTIEFGDGSSWYTAVPSSQLSYSLTNFEGDSTRDCGGGTTHAMRVTIQQSDLNGVPAGDYDDTVVVFVEPQ